MGAKIQAFDIFQTPLVLITHYFKGGFLFYFSQYFILALLHLPPLG